MISITQFCQLIQECQTSKPIFSDKLSPETIRLMQDETSITLSFFKCFMEGLNPQLNITAIESNIRSYLKQRWEALIKSNLAYTRHPFLPINQLCLKIAEAIAGPNEPVCLILMPTVRGLCRETPFSLKVETENAGHFALEEYALNRDQTLLIPVEELFVQGGVNTHVVFPDFQENLQEVHYRLGGHDFLTLEQIAGEASSIYMQALKKHHAQHFDNDSIGFAIKSLAIDLKKGSVKDAGTEEKADNEVIAPAIKSFYVLWRSLPSQVKEQITPLRLKKFGDPNVSLEDYFLALFVRIEKCVLTESELKQQPAEDRIFPCAYQISNILHEFLNQYPQLYEINISQQTAGKKELPDLKPLQERALLALKNRSQSFEADDSNLFENLTDLMTFLHTLMHYYSPSSSHSTQLVATKIASHVHSYQHLITLLTRGKIFAEVLEHVLPRLGKLHNIWNIHKLFPALSEKNQQVIIDGKFEAIYSSIRTRADYKAIERTLKTNAKINFQFLYVTRLAEQIKTAEDVLSTIKKLNTPELVEQLLTILKPRINELFNSFDLAKRI